MHGQTVYIFLFKNIFFAGNTIMNINIQAKQKQNKHKQNQKTKQKTKTNTKTCTHNDSKSVSKCSHQTKLSGTEGGEPTWLHFLSTNRWTNAGTNAKLLLRGWYQASDQQVCRFWRSVGLLHGSNLPATQQQGGQTTHLRLSIRHCELPSFFPRPLSEHAPSQKQRLIV